MFCSWCLSQMCRMREGLQSTQSLRDPGRQRFHHFVFILFRIWGLLSLGNKGRKRMENSFCYYMHQPSNNIWSPLFIAYKPKLVSWPTWATRKLEMGRAHGYTGSSKCFWHTLCVHKMQINISRRKNNI